MERQREQRGHDHDAGRRRVAGYFAETPGKNTNRWYNNTFLGGAWMFNNSGNGPWEIFNNLFHDTQDLGTDSGLLHGWNAYLPGAPLVSGWLSNDIVTNISFATGPLGEFYLPTNSPLINRGGTDADSVGLYHFTTTTNQIREGSSTVDIGFHTATLTNSLAGGLIAIDTDRDGQQPDFVVNDHEPPSIHITSPMNPVTARRRIHLDGYCEERLRSLSYTIYTNGAVLASGRGAITNQTWNTEIRYFT